MRQVIARVGFCLLLTVGCAAASIVVKPPVEQRCASVGLKGCPEVVDGVVAYLNGDKQLAEEKLRKGAAQNSPEEMRAFAELLRGVSSVPGASDYAKPIDEIALLLTGEARASTSVQLPPPVLAQPVGSELPKDAPPEPSAPSRETIAAVLALHALSAGVDPNRARTETVSLSQAGDVNTCDIAGTVGQCSPRRQGPLFVTDVASQTGCPGRIFVGAVVPGRGSMNLTWFVEALPNAMTGARLFVDSGEWLVVVFVPAPKMDPKDPRCSVTWSGFRPKAIPSGILPSNYGLELLDSK